MGESKSIVSVYEAASTLSHSLLGLLTREVRV